MSSSSENAVREGLPDLLDRLWRFAIVTCGDRATADDLVQATCQRALERADQFRAGTRLDHWTFSILASIWKNHRRAERVRRGHGVIDAEDALIADLAADIETNIFTGQVLAAVNGLPEAQRSVVMLVYVEGWTYKETAMALDVPIGTVMSRLAAARKALAPLKNHTTPMSSGPGGASS